MGQTTKIDELIDRIYTLKEQLVAMTKERDILQERINTSYNSRSMHQNVNNY